MVQQYRRLGSLVQLLLTAILIVLHHVLNLLLVASLTLAIWNQIRLVKENVVSIALLVIPSQVNLRQILRVLHNLHECSRLRVVVVAARHAPLTLCCLLRGHCVLEVRWDILLWNLLASELASAATTLLLLLLDDVSSATLHMLVEVLAGVLLRILLRTLLGARLRRRDLAF